ncbi:MAG: DNA cytosine methyltransferase, partial [Ekhidna sp.]|nr:DNA cytosine methyltransferase [Ekhidna sp.]
VVVENVPSVASRQNESESGLTDYIEDLENKGYKVKQKVVNLNDYGVPQTRKRFSLVASRVNKNHVFPKPKKGKKPTVKDVLGVYNGFEKIPAGHKDKTKRNHSASNLSEKNLKRLEGTPKNGGSALWWRTDVALGRYKYKEDGFKDNYSRMSWEKPAPTITTKFFSISNGRFAHPDEHRGISIREGATLQTFPKRYYFYSESIQGMARMIGNAVPPEYARRIGKAILKSANTRTRKKKA